MRKLVLVASSLAATVLPLSVAHASTKAGADLTITTFRVRDSTGIPVTLNPADWYLPYTTSQTSETVYGEDSRYYSGNTYRYSVASVCSSQPTVPGLALNGNACTGGIPGTSHSDISSDVFNTMGVAQAAQSFTFTLPAGYSFEIAGDGHASVRSEGVLDSSAVVYQHADAAAAIFVGPQLSALEQFSTRSLSVASDALHPVAQDSDSMTFSYGVTNTYPYPISVWLSWSASSSFGNGALPVPEAPTATLLALGLLGVYLTQRRTA